MLRPRDLPVDSRSRAEYARVVGKLCCPAFGRPLPGGCAVTVRKWLTTAVVAAGLGLGATLSATAADPSKAEYTFGSLKAATPEAAKAQAEAWLKKTGKFDQAAFNKIWAEAETSVLDRTLATLELGSPE